MDHDTKQESTNVEPLPRWAGAAGLALTVTALTAWFLVLIWPGAPARSGPNCSVDCIEYPYTAAADYAPDDFLWMIAAFWLGPLLAAVVAALQDRMTAPRRTLGMVGLVFAGISAAILMVDYYLQWGVSSFPDTACGC